LLSPNNSLSMLSERTSGHIHSSMYTWIHRGGKHRSRWVAVYCHSLKMALIKSGMSIRWEGASDIFVYSHVTVFSNGNVTIVYKANIFDFTTVKSHTNEKLQTTHQMPCHVCKLPTDLDLCCQLKVTWQVFLGDRLQEGSANRLTPWPCNRLWPQRMSGAWATKYPLTTHSYFYNPATAPRPTTPCSAPTHTHTPV